MASVASQLDKVRAGAPAAVVVEGPAGIGKTALVRRMLGASTDFQVLNATGDEGEMNLVGGIVAQLAASAYRLQVPQAEDSSDALPDAFAAGVALVDLLGRVQAKGPVTVVVDDVHWADAFSVQALAFALRRLRNDHVLAVFTTRDGSPGLPEALRRLADREGNLHLRLGGLGPSELAELGSAVSGRRLSRQAALRLFTHTGGSPLHARALLEELGQDALEDAGEVLPAPASFAMVVVARLAGCALETVNLVQAAAVLGQRCPLSAAAAVGGVKDVAQAMDEAVAAHLLESHPQRQIAFVHPLVRAAVYRDLGPARRSDLHRRAATVLEGSAALFHRVEAAVVEDPALAREVEEHAREELRRGAATSGAEALLAAARLTVDRSHRTTLVLDALDALLMAGEVGRAAIVAKEVADSPDSARRQYLLGHLALASGRQEEAEALLVQAWRLWEEAPESGLGALIAADLAQVCALRLLSAEAAEWARRAIDASTDPELTTSALSILVPCLGRVGRPADAFAGSGSFLGPAADPTSVHVEALLGRGIVRLWVDDLEPAHADFTEVVAMSRDRPASRQALVALGMLADTNYRLGAWDDSVVHAAQVVSLVEDSDQVWFGPFAHAAATWALAPRGRFERAEVHVRAAAEAGRVLGDETSVGCAATAAAHLAFFRGDFAGVVEVLRPVVELGSRAADEEPTVHPWRELHVEALLRLGRLEEAEAALAALEALAASRDLRSSSAHAARLRAELETMWGHHEAARAAFEVAVARWQDLPAPFEQARARYAYGSFLRRRGDRRAAAAYLRAAWEVFVRLGAAPLADRCQTELLGCGLTPSPRSARSTADLTPQELAVARLVALGRTNREVASELIVSPKTVEYHLSRMYTKLGVRSRTELAALLAAAEPPSRVPAAHPGLR